MGVARSENFVHLRKLLRLMTKFYVISNFPEFHRVYANQCTNVCKMILYISLINQTRTMYMSNVIIYIVQIITSAHTVVSKGSRSIAVGASLLAESCHDVHKPPVVLHSPLGPACPFLLLLHRVDLEWTHSRTGEKRGEGDTPSSWPDYIPKLHQRLSQRKLQ